MRFPCIISLFVFSFMKESLETVVQRKVNLGDTVKLDCAISYHFEISWLRQDPGEIPSVLLVAKVDDEGKIHVILQQSARFAGDISNRSISLTIRDIKEDEYALYYCAGKEGRTLQFGEGNQLLGPADAASSSAALSPHPHTPTNEPALLPAEEGDPADSETQPVTKVYVDCEKDPANHSGSGGGLFYLVYASVLGCGLLCMICAIAGTHLKIRRREKQVLSSA